MKPICFSPIILLLVIACGTNNKNSKGGDTFSEEIYNTYFSSVLTAISEEDQQALKESFVFDFEDSTLSVWNYDIVENYQSFKPYMDKYGFLEYPWIIGYNKNSLFFRDVIGTFEMPHLILYRSKEVKHLDLAEFKDYQLLYEYIVSFFES